MVSEEGGGATSFPYLGVKVRPVRGKAVLWFHCDDSGSSAEGALHEGEPVMEGFEKWACNFIVHERNCPKVRLHHDRVMILYFSCHATLLTSSG